MIVSLAGLKAETLHEAVDTASVATTILSALGLDAGALEAVKLEKTPMLPGLEFTK